MIDSETVVGTGLRISVAKDELASKLAVVARGVPSRTTVLVLGGIQLRAEANQLHLAATDMEVSLRASVDAQVADEGTVVVPGRLLLDIARSLSDGEVSIEHHPDEAVVVVAAGGADLPAREFGFPSTSSPLSRRVSPLRRSTARSRNLCASSSTTPRNRRCCLDVPTTPSG